MKIQIYESKELKKLEEEMNVQIIDKGNGILNIIPSKNSKTVMDDISSIVTQILSDNGDLALMTMNTHTEQDGTFVAVATFVSLLDIAFMLKDPGLYAVTHGLSRVWPPLA